MTHPMFISGLADIVDRFDAVLIDQYGVMHDGRRPYPGAVEAMTRLTAMGRAVIVLTNSGKRSAPNRARIERIGFPPSSYTGLVSSGEVTWQGLRGGRFGAPFDEGACICVIGKQGDDYGLDDLDLTFAQAPHAADFIVIAGCDCPRTSLDDYRAALAPAAAKNIPALCANPDRMMLTPAGLQPSSGAIAELYEALGGWVTFVGKPFPAIYRAAAELAEADPQRLLCIGDSLDHDVAGGAKAGFSTALVRTGILGGTDDAELRRLMAAAADQPTYILPSLQFG
jgi:HAD superfamily hydrolase (TIGR01459 family)